MESQTTPLLSDDKLDLKVPYFGAVEIAGDTPRASLSDIARLENVSLYEKKCMLINREIDAMGMGKYQWCIWGLCGFGYLLDLMWAQAFGLVLGSLQQEFGFGGTQSGNISAALSVGMTIGAAIWGILIDIVGRKRAFNITCLLSSAFGLALGFSNSYHTFLLITACIGFGIGGNIPLGATLTLEVIPQRNRKLLPFLSVFQPIGVVVTTALAYAIIPNNSCSPDFLEPDALGSCAANPLLSPPECCGPDNNMGWRYLLFFIGAITVAAFLCRFVIFRLRESPKFLIYRGRDEKAVKVLRQMSAFNNRHCTITLADLHAIEAEHRASVGEQPLTLGTGMEQAKRKYGLDLQRYSMLFSSPQMTRLTVLVFLTYICDYFGFTVAGTFLPIALAKKNADIHLSLTATYRHYLFIYSPGILGVLVGVLCYDTSRLGRKYTMVFSSGMMAFSMFIFAYVNSEASNITVNIVENLFQNMFNSVLYSWTAEAFPAPIRGTACGLSSFWGRMAGIASPLIAQKLLPVGTDAPGSAYNPVLYMAGSVTMFCVLWTAFLPEDMVGSESL